jgi:hypothetical protein
MGGVGMKKVLLALVLVSIVAMGSAAASPWVSGASGQFPGYAAKALSYFQNVKAQVLGEIATNYSTVFVPSMASEIYDIEHVKAEVLGILTNQSLGAYSYGNTSLIDLAEFMAEQMVAIQQIKGDVLWQLANPYFNQFTQGLWEEMTYLMKIKSKVVELLATQ